ncbi:uncharacterized protein LOC108697827 isoform X2 [Xenopus laevis]|nr:uncharacterized protein LOC108697827 isoform X2 [Xenopus laevis]OCT70980.1 hypothetical protein XELAEV_18037895mg [Xenopus laevis]
MQNHTQNNHVKTIPSPTIQSPPSVTASTNSQNGSYTCPQQLPPAPTNNKQQQNRSTQEPNVQANLQTISNSSRQAKSIPPNPTTNIPSPKTNNRSAEQIPNAAGKPPSNSGQKQDKKPFKSVSNPISIIKVKPMPSNQLIASVAPSLPFSSSVSYAVVCARNLPGIYQANQATQRVIQSPIFNLNYHAQVAPPAQVAHSRSRTESRSAVPVETLRENLSNIMKRHNSGIPIFKLQKVYLFKFGKPLSPNGYPSLRHFLVGMRDVVQIKGVGVQTLVFPVSSEMISSAVKEQHDSYLVHKNKSLHNEKMLPTSGPMSLHRQEPYIAEEPQNATVEQTGAPMATARDPHLLSILTVSHLLLGKKGEQKCPKEEGNRNINKNDVITQGQQIVTEFRDKHRPEGSVPSEFLDNSSLHNPSVVHPAMENRTASKVASVESSNHGITQQLNPEYPAVACNNISKQLTEHSDQLFTVHKVELALPLSLSKEQLHDESPDTQSHQNDREPFVNDPSMLKESPLFQTPELCEPQGYQNVSQKKTQIKNELPFFKDQQHKLILHSLGFSVVKQETDQVSTKENNERELPYQSISSSLNLQMGHESHLNSVHYREKDTDRMELKTCVQEVLPSSPSQQKTPNVHESMMSDLLTLNLQENIHDFHMDNFNKQTECKYSSHHKDSDLPKISLPGQATFYPLQSQIQLSGYNTFTMEKQIKSSPEINRNADYSNTDNSEKQHFNSPINKDQKKDNVLANKEIDGKQSLLSQIHQTPCTQSLNKQVHDPRNIKANGDNISTSLPANIFKNHWSSESPISKTHQICHTTFNNKSHREEESPTLQTYQMETNLIITDKFTVCPIVCSNTSQQVCKLNGNTVQTLTSTSVVKKKPRRKKSRALQKAEKVPADASESSSCPPPYNGSIACKIDKPESTISSYDKHHSRSPPVVNNNASIMATEKAQDQFMTSCTKDLTAWSIVCSKTNKQVRKLNGNTIERVIESHTEQKNQEISICLVKKKPRRKRSRAIKKAVEVPLDAPQSSSCPPPYNGSIACKIDKPESTISSSDKHHSMSPLVGNNNASIMTIEKAQDQFMTSCTKNLTAWSIVCKKTNRKVSKLNGNTIERVIESHFVQKKQEISTSIVKKKPRRKRSRALQKADEVPVDAPHSSSCPLPFNGSIACRIDKPESTISSSDKHHSRSPPVGHNNASIMNYEKPQDQFMTSCTEETPPSSGFAFQKMHMEAKNLNINILQQTQYTKPLDFGGKNKQADDPLNKRASRETYLSYLADSNRDTNNGSSESTTLETHQTNRDICTNKIPEEKGSPSSESDQGKKKLSTTDTMAQTVYLCSETNQQISKLTANKSQEMNSSIVKKKSRKTKSLSSPACQKTKGVLGSAPQSLHCPASHHNGLISKAESTVSYSKVHQVVSQDFCNHKANTSTLAKTHFLTPIDPTEKDGSTWQNPKDSSKSWCSIL